MPELDIYSVDSAPNCPFCQQPAPIDFEKALSTYFDVTFELDTADIATLKSNYDIQSKRILVRPQSALDIDFRFLDKAAFQVEQATIKAKLRG